MPAGATYEPIATASGNGTTATVTFSSISSSYTDLIIVSNVLSTTAGYLRMRLNADTGSNYSFTYIQGSASTVFTGISTTQTNILINIGPGFSSTIPSFSKISLFNYAGSTNKTCLIEIAGDNTTTSGEVVRTVGLWRNTSAINAIELYATSGAFSTSSTFTLYGIKAA